MRGIPRAAWAAMHPGGTIGIGTLLGRRYCLTAEIGRGGCAAVFEAHDRRLGRTVAVKLPAPGASDTKVLRFTREARVLAGIQHPNVCAALDSGVADDATTPFLVMERLYGESLRAAVSRAGGLGVREVLAIGLQLLSALDAVHAAGIVHRDVKPDNVILVSRGGCEPMVKLVDFGLCRRAVARRDDEALTREGALVGTPEYMAPEQVLGAPGLDVRVDLYAVGVVLYEALSGARTFYAGPVRETLDAVLRKPVPPLRAARRDAPRALEAILARAMARRPEDRPSSAAELQAELGAVRETIDAEADPSWEAPTTRLERRAARRPA